MILLMIQLFSFEGEVQVLTTPMFKEPDVKSKIVQYLRKGEKIFIYNPEFTSDLKIVDNFDEEIDIQIEDTDKIYVAEDFYLTLDKLGVSAYVLKKHVKIFYNDIRDLESQEIIEDTDYRPRLPLPDNYPVKNNYDAMLFGYFSIMNSYNLNYFDLIIKESVMPVIGFNSRYVKWIKNFFIGTSCAVKGSNNNIEFSHYATSSFIVDLSCGPTIAYQLPARGDGLWLINLTLPFQFLVNFMDIGTNSQNFLGVTYNIKMGLDYTYKINLKYRLMIGFELGYQPKFNLKTQDMYYLWQGRSYLEVKSNILLAATIGLSTFY